MVPIDPIPIKFRCSFVYLSYGRVDVEDNAFVLVDKKGIRTHIPVGSIACIFLEPGTVITHEAIKLAASVGTLILWVGEAGVRLYSAGEVCVARSDKLLYQASLVLSAKARLKVVQKMFEKRFGTVPEHRSVEQLRGMEGIRVKKIYADLAQQYHVEWNGRNYNVSSWSSGDPINRAISCATSCLYGITEAAIIIAGYSPALGFLHSGKPLSFVYDIADLIKFQTVIPKVFELVGSSQGHNTDRDVRLMCRDLFYKERLLDKLIPLIHEVLAAGGEDMPKEPQYVQPIAIEQTDVWAGGKFQR